MAKLKKPSERRSERIIIMLTAEEKKQIENYADNLKLEAGSWCRMAIFEKLNEVKPLKD